MGQCVSLLRAVATEVMMAMQLMLSAAIALACISQEMRPSPGDFPVVIKGEAITYETSRCSGRCPVFKVTVQPDGRGVFVGGRFTADPGIHLFWLTRDDYRAFAAKIATYRPPDGRRQSTNGHRCDVGCDTAPLNAVRIANRRSYRWAAGGAQPSLRHPPNYRRFYRGSRNNIGTSAHPLACSAR